MREFCALNGDGFMWRMTGLLNDVTGLGHLSGTIFDFGFWKCMDCGRATSRGANGEVKNTAKKS